MSRVAPRAGVFHVHRRRGVAALAAIAGVVLLSVAAAARVAAPQQPERTAQQAWDEAQRLSKEGKFAEAIPVYAQAVALAEKDPTLEKQLGQIVNAQGQNLLGARMVPEALAAFERALAIQDRVYGHDSPQSAIVVNNLAIIRRQQGNLVEAERLMVDVMSIFEKLSPNSPQLATAQNNLGSLYVDLGDFERAQPLLDKAVAIFKGAGTAPTVDYARALTNLARCYQEQGNFTTARPMLEEALAIREKLLPENHPDRILGLINLGTNLHEAGELAKADELYDRAITGMTAIKAIDSPAGASVLLGRAMIRLIQGDYAAAEPLYQRAIDIRQRVLGGTHPDTGEALQRLAVFYQVSGQAAKALEAMSRSVAIAEQNLAFTIASGSEQQKVRFMRTVQENTDIALSMRQQFGAADAQWTALASTTILQRKGRVVDAVIDARSQLRANLAESDRATFDALAKAQSTLAQVVLNPARMAPPAREARIAELTAETDRLERELAGKSTVARAELHATTVADVRAGLPAGQAVVEYVKYLPFDPKTPDRAKRFGAPRYAAFVIRGDKDLAWIELGEAAPIEAAINTWRPTLRAPKDTTVRAKGRAVYDLLVQPLDQAIAGAAHVYIVPDDVLNLLPFAALTTTDNRYLVERQSLSYLASSRDVLRFGSTTAPQTASLVIAAPQFAPANAAPGAMSFSPLPGTAREGEAIAKLVPSAKVVSGAAATEAAVKSVHGPEILHFATHAFVVGATDAKAGGAGSRGGDDRGLTPVVRITNDPAPLARAAIALAGAGAAPVAGREDGLLTALEAANLDLRGTRLVVLSACETGLGEVRAGDGVYGFRRTLTIAGAETQVLTLWKVDDAGTADLITAYYQGLSKGEGRAAALRSAQQQALKRPDRSHPYYWAALVVAGNTAPMTFERR